ncbi:hypothetical protein PYCCODRAFT_1219506 [Trametes coccinea BRFM310]|uniref:Uncharacterized protein n=1 Tax=Trametes coccinea (strain BRFM310) TaxID=1353009 RepID=A0A1Y2IVV4_TRAC3|nr:hypothetical protein PYCCODRAFT_1219506 [Trametes coccinea BRFM310]
MFLYRLAQRFFTRPSFPETNSPIYTLPLPLFSLRTVLAVSSRFLLFVDQCRAHPVSPLSRFCLPSLLSCHRYLYTPRPRAPGLSDRGRANIHGGGASMQGGRVLSLWVVVVVFLVRCIPAVTLLVDRTYAHML